MRIDENDHTVERLTEDLNGREKFFLTLASILEDVGWIEQESSGEYIITDKGNSEAKKYWYDNSKFNQILVADHSTVVCDMTYLQSIQTYKL